MPGTTAGTSPGTVPSAGEEVPATDLLTIAAGTTVVSATVDGKSAAGEALRVIDGSDSKVALGRDTDGPAVFVYELPAPTTFDAFRIPGIKEQPGNATFYADLQVEGSAESAEAGYQTLVKAPIPKGETEAEFVPQAEVPVRWVRVTLANGQEVKPGDEGKTNLEFTELIGTGEQAEVPLSTAFNGKWDLRFADGIDKPVAVMQLKQEGATVSGCMETVTVKGNVTGSIVRLEGYDSKSEQPSVYLFTVNSTGQLQGVESTNKGVFRARVGVVAPPESTTPCSDAPPPAPPSCDATVYVNFDVNSAEIRPDSTAILDDLAAGLKGKEGTITVEGHTSTEGSEESNQVLSERRAQAVVDALAARQLPAASLRAVGKGESEPLVAETDEASRSLNRRVVISCA